MRTCRLFLLAFILLPLIVLPLIVVDAVAAEPGASPWVRTEQSAVRLLSASETAGTTDELRLGLQFRLAEGWKTYWRSPGDAGFPARIDWSQSDNVAAAEMVWPAPHRFSVLGLETLGYDDEVILPIALRPSTPGEPVRVRATVDYLTCAEICIPQRANLALDLPAGPTQPSAFAHLIARYQAAVPVQDTRAQARAGLAIIDIRTVPVAADGASHTGAPDTGATDTEATGTGATDGAASAQLLARVRSDVPLEEPDIFIEGPSPLAFGAPAVEMGGGGREALLSVAVFGVDSLNEPLAGRQVVATLVDGDRAIERTVTVLTGADGAVTFDGPPAGRSFLVVLGLGVLGGLILNLMPCVLPVLSIKLLGVVGHGGGQRRTVRLSFIASAAGILASFLVLAGILIALKLAGAAVGWGFQFQQPWFLAAMVLVLFAFAANLWGLFEVRLPGWIANAGEHAGHVRGLGGHFLTGALATLLATPCSAPFLGTAVGFALSRGAVEIMAVFTAVALGLATPYLAVAAMPALATRLPRPGPWMIVLRRVLGVALVVTALWLITVLAVQIGVGPALVFGALATAVAALVALGSRDRKSVV